MDDLSAGLRPHQWRGRRVAADGDVVYVDEVDLDHARNRSAAGARPLAEGRARPARDVASPLHGRATVSAVKPGPHDVFLTRVKPFFSALVGRDPSATTWLTSLLAATPNGHRLLATLLSNPGSMLEDPEHPDAELGFHEQVSVLPDRDLLLWYIDNPDQLRWPRGQPPWPRTESVARRLLIYVLLGTGVSNLDLLWYAADPWEPLWPTTRTYPDATTGMRQALLGGYAPSRGPAQWLAREALQRFPSGGGWWNFEAPAKLDCVLITDRLVLVIRGDRRKPDNRAHDWHMAPRPLPRDFPAGSAPNDIDLSWRGWYRSPEFLAPGPDPDPLWRQRLPPASDWFTQRSLLVGDLEAARVIAGERAWATLLISEDPVPESSPEEVALAIPASSPHLATVVAHARLDDHYLGAISWREACRATQVAFESLPASVADLPAPPSPPVMGLRWARRRLRSAAS